MKANTTNHTSLAAILRRFALLAIPACALASCASVQHPLTRHDMDGDGAISDSEYRQNHMQYNMASRQRADEYSRARLVTAHAENAGDFLGQAHRVANLLGGF
jgi:hypothetical protein